MIIWLDRRCSAPVMINSGTAAIAATKDDHQIDHRCAVERPARHVHPFDS
jgi:hypothetical protein